MSPSHVVNVLSPFEAPYGTRSERAEAAQGLRELAEWIETTEFPIPRYTLWGLGANVYSNWIEDEGFVQRPASAAKLIGGKVNKGVGYNGGPFELTRDFGGGVRFTYSITRTVVCTPVEVTKDLVTNVPVDEKRANILQEQIDDLQAKLKEIPTETRTVPTKVTEYVCPPSLLEAERAMGTTPAIDTDSVPF